jgi:hypothetical protein
MTDTPDRWQQDISQIRQALARLLRQTSDPQEPVGRALELLEQLDGDVRLALAKAARWPRKAPETQVRRNQPKEYRVERHGGGEFLAEHRQGGRQAFLCPRDVYEAAAAILAETDQPRHFEVLLERLSAQLGRTISEYLLRVCLRFWMGLRPALAEKTRTFYKAVRPAGMTRDAKRAWRELTGQPKS